ncbi:hypothetical protein TQ29_06650 [Actibacterium sp. EMB200-NS6]|nr:hypothetical protein TQ29_06650 [Actibacterium sp. EMB200-NS6]
MAMTEREVAPKKRGPDKTKKLIQTETRRKIMARYEGPVKGAHRLRGVRATGEPAFFNPPLIHPDRRLRPPGPQTR